MHAEKKRELLLRIEELSREIREYPSPIARCDLHLPALLEERADLLKQLKELETNAGGCTPLGTWTNDGGFNAA